MTMDSYTVIFPLLLMMIMLIARATTAAAQGNANCPGKCGNISVPYPFGTDEHCSMDERFFINCVNENPFQPTSVSGNGSTSTLHKALLQNSDTIQVLDINMEEGVLRVLYPIFSYCYHGSTGNYSLPYFNDLQFKVSNTRNTFTAIGCNIYAAIESKDANSNVPSSCALICHEGAVNEMKDGVCSGVGCCQRDIPIGMGDYNITLNYTSHNCSDESSFCSNCSYAFVVENGAYSFSISDLFNNSMDNKTILPLILDWSVGNQSCLVAKKDAQSFACKGNSTCYDTVHGDGYLCKCIEGFEGNPYVIDGCKDIDECQTSHPCISNGTCVNKIGNFTCICPEGYAGDGRIIGTGCYLSRTYNKKRTIVIGTTIGVGFGLPSLLVGVWWLYKILKKRRMVKLKRKLFERNGGLLLEKKLSSNEGGMVKSTKLFTSKELQRATDDFNHNRVLGIGGQGMVYKGMLQDGMLVAIKKSKLVSEGQLDEFINEIVILSNIDHRNIVKLLGCCLETEVPLLVYEFIPNGTLFNLLHHQCEDYQRSWETRLRIASEVAAAISHLHSSASVPIFHRDIKSDNILLDEKFRAKVSDFGISRSLNIEQTHLTTQVLGTIGYIDPEYLQSSHFTEKSDVYSFGVVLVELLTGQKPISAFRPQEKRGLVSYFMSSIEENQLLDTLDAQLLRVGQREELLAVAQLAKDCLNMKGRKRPTMKQVAMELERLRNGQGYSPTQLKQDDVFFVNKLAWDFPSSSSTMPLNLEDCSIVSESDVHPLRFNTV